MNFMAIDQRGTTFHNLGKHPRKVLLERLGYKKASIMYRDKPLGATVQVGYVIGPHWLLLYKVEPFEKPTKFVRSQSA